MSTAARDVSPNSGPHRPRPEGQAPRTGLRAVMARAANFGRRFHAGQMLAHQAGLGAAGANVIDGEGFPRHHRKGEGGAQNLPAALAFGAIDQDHFIT